MTNQQLHDIAMLALSKTEFTATHNPVELAAEMFQQYHKVIDTLQDLDKGEDNVCVIDDFGTASPACARARK